MGTGIRAWKEGEAKQTESGEQSEEAVGGGGEGDEAVGPYRSGYLARRIAVFERAIGKWVGVN